jgi:DNA-binding YbaB/EbfC family protein
MKGRGHGMQALMRQAGQMQAKLKRIQEELAAKSYTASSGGDGVKVTVNGSYKVLKVEINPEVISAGDKEMLEDLILTATNEALETAKKDSNQQMAQVTGGLNFPGLT